MKIKFHTSKIFFQSVFFITVLFLHSSCSNKSETNTEQSKQENQKSGIVKQDSVFPPLVTVIDNLPDSSKPKEFFLEKTPIAQSIIIPPNIIPLAVLKNEKGVPIKDKDGNPFILGEAGGTSNFINYTTDQGLALDAINCGFRDKTGNLWFGTYGAGVSRYDGKAFTNFTTAQGLAHNIVLCIMEDKMGNLWFGTDGGGASRYDGKAFTNFTTAQGLADNTVLSIIEDKKGNLWLGTNSGGVSRYDESRADHPCNKNSCTHDLRIQQDFKEHTNELAKAFTNFTTAQGLANNHVSGIAEDKKGNLWFGTDGGGVSCYDGNRANHPCNKNTCTHDLRIQQDLKEHTNELAKAFTNYTTAQGLANNYVLSITADKRGDLWFGTNGGGLSRYDGNRANHPCNKNTCTHDLQIQQGLKEHTNELAKIFTNFTTAQGLANNSIRSITEDKMGNLWFGTDGGGLSRYDGNQVEKIEVAIQKEKIIPQQTQQDLKKINKNFVKAFTNFTTAQGLANNNIKSITEDKMGNLWFGTDGGGVSRYDGKAFTNFTMDQGLADKQVLSIMEDKRGNLWFGTYGGGVSCYDGKAFTNFTTAQGLANNFVLSITEDKRGNLWFGTYGGGVSRYDGNRVEAIEAALQRGEIVPQRTQQDLKKINGKLVKSFTNFSTAQGLANNIIRCIKEDKTGNLWFGTNGGVSRYDERQSFSKSKSGSAGTFTNYTTAQGLANNFVFGITEDKRGNLWFGTSGGGVSRYDGNRVEAIEAALQRGEIVPQRTQQDLKKINGKLVKSFTNFTTAQGLGSNFVFSMVEDKMGNLWVGTAGGGISRYDGREFSSPGMSGSAGRFTNFTTANGLPDNTVTQIVITKEQNIAIGTNYGLGLVVSFSPKGNSPQKNIPAQNNLNNEELKNYTPVIEIYNSTMGYPVKDVNTGQNTMFTDSNGIIWIATGADKTALVRFDYAALNKNKMPPDVLIQGIKINNEIICWHNLERSTLKQTDSTTTAPNITEEVTTLGKVLSDEERNIMRQKFSELKFDGITKFYPLPENLLLPYKNNNVTFDFAAIEPAKPYLVRYQYILEGYDNDWSPVTNATTATFGNIDEGAYTFKLKAQSPFGVWSEPIEYKFTVLPPWWRTWWMYSIYGISAITIVVLIVWWNGRRLRAKATELTEEVRKATHTITEKQKEIIDSITYAKRIQHAMLPHLKDIETAFPQSFVLFKPKDIVSGDFYFFHVPSPHPVARPGSENTAEGLFIIGVADCTGHGVPGAFMSMIGSAKLHDAVSESADTSEILSLLNKGIKTALKQSDSDESTRDGMDIALCSVDIKKRIVKYAGANRPIWIVRKGQSVVEEIKATKKAIGGLTEDTQHFDSHELNLQQGDTFYICTDGYADQFGGKDGKKLMTKKLKEVLIEIQNKPMKEQERHLDSFIENWKAGLEQIDDILIIGVRV
ncbi:MAG: two-component regulator propeller domain-containing protein [Bacteroidota bacterium]